MHLYKQPEPQAFCHACGSRYENPPLFPKERTCEICKTTRWFNPTPISVLLVPVEDSKEDRIGILKAQRGISPKLGEWGLIGGFVESTDVSYERAAQREFWEEIGIPLPSLNGLDSEIPNILFSTPGDPGQIISFCENRYSIPLELLQQFTSNEETLAIDVMWEPEALCFSSHTLAAERWFKNHKDSWKQRNEINLLYSRA